AVEECGAHPAITNCPEDVVTADRVILPGVGAFPEAMENLRRTGLADALHRRVAEEGHPFLGICLGMQLMATAGTEISASRGLGWIPGEVRRIAAGPRARVPHIGWNEVHRDRDDVLFDGVTQDADFYFVHSFVVVPEQDDAVIGYTPYGDTRMVSALRRDNMWGVQFHPEKSQKIGFRVLRNFLAA
ncbi:MAG TPA: imidazole glycerol phosphate synthase subunit HisH, partial [Vicinamibacterales bacterium]|nr:imidazole glycerol phosphate synthase subunit HisH [Vicinamibacterales bacterium]